MRRAETTIRLRLRVSVYRILYAMGGVEVLAVEDLPATETSGEAPASAGADMLAVTLRLSSSMLTFALEMAGPEQAERVTVAEEPAPG